MSDKNAIIDLLTAITGTTGLRDIGSFMSPEDLALCKISFDTKVDAAGNLQIRCGDSLHLAEEALNLAQFVANYSASQGIDVIVAANHQDAILAAFASGLKGSHAFATITKGADGKFNLEGPDQYPARPLKFLFVAYLLGQATSIVEAATFLKATIKDAIVVGAYTIIDTEAGGMANLASANIPLQRLFTKNDIISHIDFHKTQDEELARKQNEERNLHTQDDRETAPESREPVGAGKSD